jgi:llaI.3
MIKTCAHDGEKYNSSLFSSHGFNLDENRDIKEVDLYDSITGEKTGDTETILDFVGFVTNDNDDLLVVFPKHYKVSKVENDARAIFDCISKHSQKRPELYIGEDAGKTFSSNYPFAAFFGIYDYFVNYGLYFKDKTFIKPNTGGRLSWKETISKSEKFIVKGDVVMFPLYYRKNYHFSNFITECMIFAIDYTIQKFGVFINASSTGQDFPELNFLEEREYVLNVLSQLRQQTFKDTEQQLIDNLLIYFSEVNIGGAYYLKHYSFSSIWEDMVTDYLCKLYKGVDASHAIVFDKISPSGLHFEKKSFHTNGAKPAQYISPDHYCEDSKIQLIFDAKYYSYIRGMNYKQIAYMFMLRGIKDPVSKRQKFANTYSALILPSENRDTKIHFQLDDIYGGSNDLIITEEYIDIREVIHTFIE